MSLLLLLAVACSAIFLLLLGISDPKRQRAAGRQGKAHAPAVRPLLVVFAALPGVLYAFTAASAAFLIWLGGCTVIGWLITMLLSTRQKRA